MFISQTFIRHVKPKVLSDSPALNDKSRAVLVSAPPPPLPMEIPGHGPPAPRPRSPPPPLPSSPDGTHNTPSPLPPSATLNSTNLRDAYGEEEDDGEAEQYLMNRDGSASDPYAGLAGAFGDYTTDELNSSLNKNGKVEDEDLLF